jgi:hypothetical protein
MMDENWFPCFAEVPGIIYESPKELNFNNLRGRGVVPEINYDVLDGKRHKSIMWKTEDGGTTSASPAHVWETKTLPGETAAITVLRQVYEVLELPGTLSDYHFALQGAHEGLKKYIGKESWVLPAIEKLCWLNVRLIENHPKAISYENDRGIQYAQVSVFNRLISLYEKEGYLHEALEVANIAERFGYSCDVTERLEERIKLLESEDVYP